MTASYNPTQHGACNWSSRVKATWKTFPRDLGAHIFSEVISTPNGQSWGTKGHIPCDHVLHLTYEHGSAIFDGIHRKEFFLA